MKKIILAATVLINLSFTKVQINHSEYSIHKHTIEHFSHVIKRDAVVYICNGPKAYAYHSNSRCSGLNNCSAEISALNLSNAINRGRRACQRCY